MKAGDVVELVSPGSASRMDDVKLCMELLEGWGLKPRLSKETFAPHPFHSNLDKVRLELLKQAYAKKDAKAIWCLRGGYGANRLLPALYKLKAPAKNKILIGYSDITSLHLLGVQKWGLQAPVLGGNLVVLESAIGTVAQPNLKGKILVLEEIGERGYRIDRMLEHLKQAGVLKGCKAIVFGDFLGGSEKDGQNFVDFALERFAKDSEIPCFSGLEIGHGEKQRIVAFGPLAKLSGGKDSQLVVPTGVKK